MPSQFDFQSDLLEETVAEYMHMNKHIIASFEQ